MNENINIRVDKNEKENAEKLFSQFGINLNVPNADTLKAIEDTEKGLNLSKRFNSVSDLMEDL